MDLVASTYQTELLKCGLNLAFGAILLLWNDRVVTGLNGSATSPSATPTRRRLNEGPLDEEDRDA